MMKTLAFVMFTVAVGLFAGCGGDAANVRSNAEMANKIEKAVAAAPTRGLLVGLETKAFEAWKNNDAAFWDEYLDSKFVSYTGGVRYDKAGEIKQITETTRKMFDNPKVMEKIAAFKMEAAYASPDEVRQIVERNTEFWGEQVRKSNFQAQ